METLCLTCKHCKLSFNNTTRTPRILISCGHSFCEKCLRHLLNNNAIRCPTDNTLYDHIENIENLPKNVSLLEIINKTNYIRQANLSFSFSEDNLRGKLHLDPLQQNSFEDENKTFGFRNRNTFSNLRCFTPSLKLSEVLKADVIWTSEFRNSTIGSAKKENLLSTNDLRRTLKLNSTNNKENNCNAVKLCNEHKRPLEVICMDHRVKICTNCALFGSHKGHDIKNDEDFMKEISLKAEILIELFEMIEMNSINYSENVMKLLKIFSQL